MVAAVTSVVACSAGDDPSGAEGGGALPGGETGSKSPPGGGATPGSEGGDVVVDVEPPPAQAMDSEEDCDTNLEVTYRDFDSSHPDFEMGFSGDVVRLNLLEPELGADGTPVFKQSVGQPPDKMNPNIPDTTWTPSGSVITSAETFHDWYHDVPGTNYRFDKQLELKESAPGSAVYVYDTNEFFPLSADEGFGAYQNGKNFLFTTEIHLLFTYVSGQKFRFRGDDDLWIFVNRRLALDRGSMHRADEGEGTIDFDDQAAALGISPGGTYRMDVFHAERHTSESNFRIETNIGCFRPAPPIIQ